ncbi:MAG: hypothetical protein JWM98_1900 [Thermoleophilia bacterium]|nr:hypothetical protein [Thermoleophilia bacterium]
MGVDTTPVTDEPAAAAPMGAAAGSSHVAPSPMADALRALVCALLVAVSAGSPASAILVAPFVPALVAIRLVRARRGRTRFLVAATLGSIAAAALVAPELPGSVPAAMAFAVAMAVLLVPALGIVHERAARPDPVVAVPLPWPEPTLRSGLAPTVLAWSVAVVVVLGLAAAVVDSSVRGIVRTEYSEALRECRSGGALESMGAQCDQLRDQRDTMLDLLDGRVPIFLGVFAATVAVGAAVTTHPVVLARARRRSSRVRPPFRLRELEVHWSAAYLVAAGIVAWLATDGDPEALEWVRAVGIGLGTLGALLLSTQGVGLLAWLLTRRRVPGWYRVFLVFAAFVAMPFVPPLLFGLGVLDQALHPRRRALASATLPDRGSGS